MIEYSLWCVLAGGCGRSGTARREGVRGLRALLDWKKARQPTGPRSRRRFPATGADRRFPPPTTWSGARRRSPTAARRSASTPATPGCISSGPASVRSWTATRRPSRTTTASSGSTPTRPRHSRTEDPAGTAPPPPRRPDPASWRAGMTQLAGRNDTSNSQSPRIPASSFSTLSMPLELHRLHRTICRACSCAPLYVPQAAPNRARNYCSLTGS